MRGFPLFIFIVFLPAILILGHDIFLFTQNYALKDFVSAAINQDESMSRFFTDLGFIWTNYFPQNHNDLAKTIEPQIWTKISGILKHKAILVALFFAGASCLFILILRFLSAWLSKRKIKRFG